MCELFCLYVVFLCAATADTASRYWPGAWGLGWSEGQGKPGSSTGNNCCNVPDPWRFNTNPRIRIRIHTKMSRIRNSYFSVSLFSGRASDCLLIKLSWIGRVAPWRWNRWQQCDSSRDFSSRCKLFMIFSSKFSYIGEITYFFINQYSFLIDGGQAVVWLRAVHIQLH